MPNWSARPIPGSARLNPDNPAVTFLDFEATNSVTNERITEMAVGSDSWTVGTGTSYCEQMVRRLNQRDASRASAASALPGITAFLAQGKILATG